MAVYGTNYLITRFRLRVLFRYIRCQGGDLFYKDNVFCIYVHIIYEYIPTVSLTNLDDALTSAR